MPHSLRAKIKGLRYKGIITDKDCDRLCKALDTEKVIDDIKAEIQASMDMYKGCEYIGDKARRDELWHVLEIIDRHTGERSTDADSD